MRLAYSVLIALLLLSGCSGGKEDDLDRWMKEKKTQTKGKIDPLPQLKDYVPFPYNADNSLTDPFRGRKVADMGRGGTGKSLQPDMKRPREVLESFPLENLKFVGYMQQGNKSVALIAAPDNTVYQIKPGNYMGQNYGVVTGISKDEVAIKEMVQDGTGGYIERRVTINPQE